MSDWMSTTTKRKGRRNATYRKHTTAVCPCGKPLDTGWTNGGYNNRTRCLLCITADVMQDFTFIPQKRQA